MAKRGTNLIEFFEPRILIALKEGLPFGRSCVLAGASPITTRKWLALGKAHKSGKYFEFYNKVRMAMAEAERVLVGVIFAAARGGQAVIEKKTVEGTNEQGCYSETAVTEKTTLPQWQPAAWLLARRNVAVYGNEASVKTNRLKEGNGLTPEEFAEKTFLARQKMAATVPTTSSTPKAPKPVGNAEELLLKAQLQGPA